VVSTVVSIERTAFETCSGLLAICILASARRIRDSAFCDCRALGDVTFERRSPCLEVRKVSCLRDVLR
jgi:hypothetical protein